MRILCARLLCVATQVACLAAWCAAACSVSPRALPLFVTSLFASFCVPPLAFRSIAASWQLGSPPTYDAVQGPARVWLCHELPLLVLTFWLAGAIIVTRPLPPGSAWVWLQISMVCLCALSLFAGVAAAWSHARDAARRRRSPVPMFMDSPLVSDSESDGA